MKKYLAMILLAVSASSQAVTPIFGPWELYRTVEKLYAFGQPLTSPPYAVRCEYKRYQTNYTPGNSRVVESQIVLLYTTSCPSTY